MNKKIKEVKRIVKRGCDKRKQFNETSFSCPNSDTCPCAENCLTVSNLFTPKEAGILWLVQHHVNHNHNYRTDKTWQGAHRECFK